MSDEIKWIPVSETVENGVRDLEQRLKTVSGEQAVKIQRIIDDSKRRLEEMRKPEATRVMQRIPLKIEFTSEGGTKHTPHEWAQAMATTLREALANVSEGQNREAIARIAGVVSLLETKKF